MIRPADPQELRRLVGAATFTRGERYARQGAVLHANWDTATGALTGAVQGTAAAPYRVSGRLVRTAGNLLSLQARCSCPVGVNCKHVVALLLAPPGTPGTPQAAGTPGTPGTPEAADPAGSADPRSPDATTSPGADRRGPATSGPAPWETMLAPLVAPGTVQVPPSADSAGGPPPGTIGLQFELAEHRPPRPAAGRADSGRRAASPGGPGMEDVGVRLRPVLPGHQGNWVRTGISWADLDTYLLRLRWTRHAAPGASAEEAAAPRVALLKELLALSTVTGGQSPYAYSYRTEPVWLDRVVSRRVWDLLAQAEDLGIVLVGPGRQAPAVTLHRTPAQCTLDITRTAGGDLLVAPRLLAGDGEVEIEVTSSVAVGDPAHGMVWWDRPGAEHAAMHGTAPASTHAATPASTYAATPASTYAATPASTYAATPASTRGAGPGAAGGGPGALRLHLAALDRPLTGALADLLALGPLVVPAGDGERFLHEMQPRLRRAVAVRSSDGSVTLPEPPPPALRLAVHHGDGQRLTVAWSADPPLPDGSPGGSGTVVLRPGAAHPGGPEVADAAAAAAEVLRQVPGLVARGPGGELLAAAELHGLHAARFAAEVLPALGGIAHLQVEEHGPAPAYREETAAPTVTLGGSHSRDGDWFDLAVEVDLQGEPVPFQALFVALAERQTHLLLPSGTYFSLERPELAQLAELIAEARALQDTPGDTLRLSRYQAGLWDELQHLGICTAQAEAWAASVRALVDAASDDPPPVPVAVEATLRPYQRDGFAWLAFLHQNRLGGILADDMGLGKTLQALALIAFARDREPGSPPWLVVAPTSVVGGWVAECARFAPTLRATAVTQTAARRGVPLAELAEKADLVVTSYALFRIEHQDYHDVEWGGLVLDEAQFAKNPASHTYRHARTLAAPFKLAITGTPMENHLLELWALLSITAPGLFPRADRFTEHYRLPIERRADAERLAQLRRRIRPLMLRRTKEQVAAELPDKLEQTLVLDLEPRHQRVYQTYLQRERQKVLGLLDDVARHRIAILRSLTVLRQAALAAGLVDAAKASVPSTKLDALMPMLVDIVDDGHRVLVFSQFTRFLTMARQRIRAAGIDHCYLDGRTRRRTEVIDRFRTGEAPVFLISLKAGGFGLNLTEADYAILLDPWWNPATEAQAVDRVHRIGQTRKVMVYRLVARDTIEEKVMAMKARKAALFANVIDSGALASGTLTADEIRALLD